MESKPDRFLYCVVYSLMIIIGFHLYQDNINTKIIGENMVIQNNNWESQVSLDSVQTKIDSKIADHLKEVYDYINTHQKK
jgi:hypothetical protein